MVTSFLERIFGEGPKPCKACQLPAKDLLVENGSKPVTNYCRQHLLQEFGKHFTSFSYKMVVFHPELERKYCDSQYPYYPLEEMVKKFNFETKAEDKIRTFLSEINGQCEWCHERVATVCYFVKGALPWDIAGPVLEKIEVKGKKLCPQCSLQLIQADLMNNKGFFVEKGLMVPYLGNGVYVNTQM